MKISRFILILVLFGAVENGSTGKGVIMARELSTPGHSTAEAGDIHVYVGTYTSTESKGIYLFRLNPRTGDMGEPELAAETINPSFLSIHPDLKHLYSVNEISEYEGEKTGAVTAFQIEEESGRLTSLNQSASGGTGPCFIVTDQDGKFALVANYGGGSVASIEIRPDGRLGQMVSVIQHQGSGTDPARQKNPHAHSIQLDHSQKFALAADLGVDKVFIYRFSSTKGTLTPHSIPSLELSAGSGPRHFAFHPTAPYIFVINELSSTIAVIENRDFANFNQIQEITTLPENSDVRNSTAEILVHPSGKFLYASNRGHDSIAVFRINPESGRLEPIGFISTGGKTPRNFSIDPSGQNLIVANQNSSNIVGFKIDQETGELTNTGQVVKVPTPVCIRFLKH